MMKLAENPTKLPFLTVATIYQAAYAAHMMVQLAQLAQYAGSAAHTTLHAAVAEEASTAQAPTAAESCRPSSG
jgi:hypothetical protein